MAEITKESKNSLPIRNELKLHTSLDPYEFIKNSIRYVV